jgi:anti-sigma-K factor RskA
MPTWLAVLLVALGALVVVLALGGAVVAGRRRRAREPRLVAELEAVNAQLAAACAADKGWEREALDAAARREWAARHPDEEPLELALIEVVDLPGQEQDVAVFRVVTPARAARLELGRRAGEWHAVRVEQVEERRS